MRRSHLLPLFVLPVAVLLPGCSDDHAKTVTRMTTRTVSTTKTVTREAAPPKDRGRLRVRVIHEPEGAAERRAAKVLDSKGLRASLAAIDDSMLLKRDITIRVGDGADEDGPYYDPNDRQIRMPYSFVVDTERSFREADYASGKDLQLATREVTTFVLYHELAHALIDQLELPVLGREEDAADSFAVLLAIELDDDGDIAISAADSFDISSEDNDSDVAAYWDEHSLDEQRFYSLLCLVYGSDSKRYSDAFDSVKIDRERKSSCPDDWSATSRNWHHVMDRYLSE